MGTWNYKILTNDCSLDAMMDLSKMTPGSAEMKEFLKRSLCKSAYGDEIMLAVALVDISLNGISETILGGLYGYDEWFEKVEACDLNELKLLAIEMIQYMQTVDEGWFHPADAANRKKLMKKLEKRLLGADYKEPVKKCKRTYVESKSWTFAKTGQEIFLGDVVEIQLVKCPDTYAKEFMTDDNRVTVKITSMSSLLITVLVMKDGKSAGYSMHLKRSDLANTGKITYKEDKHWTICNPDGSEVVVEPWLKYRFYFDKETLDVSGGFLENHPDGFVDMIVEYVKTKTIKGRVIDVSDPCTYLLLYPSNIVSAKSLEG